MNYEERQKIIADSPISFKYLKRFNIAAGFLHLIQGITMLALGLLSARANTSELIHALKVVEPGIFAPYPTDLLLYPMEFVHQQGEWIVFLFLRHKNVAGPRVSTPN